MEVGNFLKTPFFPVWVICKEFHYSVLFANDSRVNENTDLKKFDLIYYDELS
jgi:ubiquitin carboxyl-terminal hydrolase MINDY-3/4